MWKRGLQRVEAVVERQQRVTSERQTTASFSVVSVVDLGSLGPVHRSAVDERLRRLVIVFWMTQWRLARALRLSLLCCIARRTTSVVVALSCRTWPIALPSTRS
jgi:hypothetical protein